MDTPLDKKLIGNQDKLPEALKAKIEAAPESPAKFMGAFNTTMIRQGEDLINNRFLSRESPASGMQRMVDKGYIRDNFSGGRSAAERVYGTPDQLQASMPFESPMQKKNCNKKY